MQQQLLPALPKLPPEQREAALNSLLHSKVMKDPSQAAAYISKLQESGNPADFQAAQASLNFLATEWSGHSPQAAMEWA